VVSSPNGPWDVIPSYPPANSSRTGRARGTGLCCQLGSSRPTPQMTCRHRLAIPDFSVCIFSIPNFCPKQQQLK